MKTRIDSLRIKGAVFSGMLFLLGCQTGSAVLREWTGDRQNDNSWTEPNNWLSGAPNPGDDLLFITLKRHPQNQNDYPDGTTFNSIEIRGGGPWGGYNIGGNTIALNAGLLVENNSGGPVDHQINNAFLLNSNQTFTINNSAGSFSLTGPVNLNGQALLIDVIESLGSVFSGQISGAGGVVKTGSGPLTLSGNNTLTGSTTLSGGTLWINGSQPSSPVMLVGGVLRGTGTVGTLTSTGSGGAGTIVVSPGASPGVLASSSVALNASTTLSVELNGTVPGTGHDQLNVTGTVSLGNATLDVSLGFVPALGSSFLIINNDGSDPVSGRFSGLAEGAIFYLDIHAVQISYFAGTGNDVALTVTTPPPPPVTRVWDGGGAGGNWTTPANWALDSLPAAGNDLIFPTGVTKVLTTNGFPLGTVFNSVTISNSGYVLAGSRIVLNAGVAAYLPSGAVEIITPLTLNSNQVFSVSGGFLSLSAQMDTAGNTLTLWTDSELQTGQMGAIVGSGGMVKAGPGLVTFGGAHSYTGLTEVRDGKLLIVTGAGLGSAVSGTVVSNGATLALEGGVTVSAEPLALHGRLETSTGAGNAPSTWNGLISLEGNGAEIVTAPQLVLANVISGSGSLQKGGSGNLLLAANNTYSGPTTNAGGNLFVEGSQPQSQVFLVSGMLSGRGTVGIVQAVGFTAKTLSPGGPAITHGLLTCSNVTLSSSTIFRVDISGSTPGSGYDQLDVNGNVSLQDATLSVISGFHPAPGSTFTVIVNDGNDPVVGTFNGLPQGATLSLNGKLFQISYTGGTGNDVVLTSVTQNTGFVSITKSGNGHMALAVTGGVSGFSYSILAATNLGSSITWSNIGSATANGTGAFSFTDTNAPLFPIRFYRSSYP